jgi:glycosyltransferase involved in cell wall biosynthesis
MVADQDNISVTAVIPAYNAERFISDAIQSVLAQTHEVTEVIVVDDGSSDETSRIAARFPRTRVIRQSNGGAGAARNTGIKAASSEWVAFLDSDDTWLPRKTELQLKNVAPEAGVIHCNRFNPINFGNLWHRQAHVSPSGALVRKQTLIDVGGFEESRTVMGAEDLNLWLRIALTDWRFVQSELDLFNYRPTENSLSANEVRMAHAELTNIDMVGKRLNCDPEETVRIKQSIRIEYAKNLIATKRWNEASQVLQECAPGLAQLWLSLAGALKTNRLARTNLVRSLQALNGRFGSHECSGDCSLTSLKLKECAGSCHQPYCRPF